MSIEVLIATIELLDEGRKWTNNINQGPRDCYCLYTALAEASNMVTHQNCEYSAWPSGLERVLSAGQFAYRSDIFYWNDRSNRTWEDVKTLLERAISQPFIPPGMHQEETGKEPENDKRPDEDTA